MDKKEQERLLIEIMEADAKDGLYEQVPIPGNNQSAVEWLLMELKSYVNPIIQDEYRFTIPKNEMVKIIEQSKRMEDDQLLAKFGEGYDEGLYDALNK